MRYTFSLILIVLSCLAVSAQVPDWFIKLQNLQKFPSSEKEVEKLFNSPEITYSSASDSSDKSWGKLVTYKIPEGELDILYSTGRCSNENIDGYDLESGIILSYYFYLKPNIEISKLKLNLNKFPAVKGDDTEHWYFYNAKKGVKYAVLAERLQTIHYSPPEKNYRSCKDIRNKAL